MLLPMVIGLNKAAWCNLKQVEKTKLNAVITQLLKTRETYQKSKSFHYLKNDTNELIKKVNAYGKPLNNNICFRRVEDIVMNKYESSTEYGPLIGFEIDFEYKSIEDPIQVFRDPIDGKSEVTIDDLLADLEEQVKLQELKKFRTLRRCLNSENCKE